MKRKDRPYVVLAAVCLAIGIAASYFMSGDAAKYEGLLAAQRSELTALENTLEVRLVDRTKADNEVLSLVTGMDADRKAADDAAFEEFIRPVCTWSGMAEYRAMCAEVSSHPAVDKSSTFKQVFLGSPLGVQGTTIEGEVSCRFDSASSRLVSIDGDKYVYFTTVNVYASIGGGSRSASFVCTYSMGVDHELSDLHAYVTE